jgi:hypothetical protein
MTTTAEQLNELTRFIEDPAPEPRRRQFEPRYIGS